MHDIFHTIEVLNARTYKRTLVDIIILQNVYQETLETMVANDKLYKYTQGFSRY